MNFAAVRLRMERSVERRYVKTRYEGVYYRLSRRKDPQTGVADRIYAFWYADAAGRGHWKTAGRHSAGMRPEQVKALRASFLAEMHETGICPAERDSVTVGALVENYVRWARHEGRHVEQHHGQYRTHLEAHVRDMPVVDLTPDVLARLKAILLVSPVRNVRRGRRRTLSRQTMNHIFSFLRSAINHGIAARQWYGGNPLSTRGGLWKMPEPNNCRLRWLTCEEVRMLLEYLLPRDRQLHDMVLLSLRTGLRPTEMFRLKGEDIDAGASILHIVAKGGRRTPVKVPADIAAMLLAYRRLPSEPLFKAPRTGRAYTKTPASFRRAVSRLGLARDDGDSLYAVTLHTMRHTFASWLAQSGQVSLMELQKLMRHRSIHMTMRYAHLIPGQELEKLAIIEGMLKEAQPGKTGGTVQRSRPMADKDCWSSRGVLLDEV